MGGAAGGCEFELAGMRLCADPSGVLFAVADSLLVVSDLHLEKGSSFAARGMMLPPWDTAATLDRLAQAIERWRPRRIVALGDSFHDDGGCERLTPGDRASLAKLQSRREWIWIAGNHDGGPKRGLAGEQAEEVSLGRLRLRHQPALSSTEAEIAGHLHPVARVVTARGSVRRRCFVVGSARCVMPAFGAYAGGLNFRDAAYLPFFPSGVEIAHVLGRRRVHRVPARACADD